MVADSLNDLHDSIEQIPPQNKAYAVGMLFDKLMTISGRPTNITASANVKLGTSDMSPNQVRDILKKGVKNLPQEASKEKVIDIEDAETTETTGLTAFNSDGFTVGALAQLNTNTDTYVSWNWKAGRAR